MRYFNVFAVFVLCDLQEMVKFEQNSKKEAPSTTTTTTAAAAVAADGSSVDQTTTPVVVVRGMQGMSSMGKPQRPGVDVRSMLMGHPKSQASKAPPTNEFLCTCSTGWTGATCEISKYSNCHLLFI